jgi:hypothetical protein
MLSFTDVAVDLGLLDLAALATQVDGDIAPSLTRV